jgi:integrase
MGDRHKRARSFGTIRRLPSGRWQVRYYDQAGIRHTAPRTFPSKADASRYLAQVEADLLRGAWTDPRLARITFGEWAERWWQTTADLRPGTRTVYRYLLRRFLLPAFASAPLGRIDPMTVRSWLAGLHQRGEVTPTTIAKAYRLLRRILNVAVEAGYLPRNPAAIKGAGLERAAEMRHVSIPQLHALAGAVPGRYRALVLVAGYGGLRWGELVGLRRRRVDLGGARIHVVEQVAEVAGKFLVSPPKTAAGQRVVVLPAVAVAALAEHLDDFAAPELDGLVFRSGRGTYLQRSNFSRLVWRPAVQQLGLDGLRFHDLRHTAATLAAAAGATTKELMERMGHTSPVVALRYQHVMPDRQAALASAMDLLVTNTVAEKQDRDGPAEPDETATDDVPDRAVVRRSSSRPPRRSGTRGQAHR